MNEINREESMIHMKNEGDVREHTPEPWKVGGDYKIVVDNGTVIAECWTEFFHFNSATLPANARRIVACVNLCRGVTIETIEHMAAHGVLDSGKTIDTLRTQRDEMRNLLTKLADWCDSYRMDGMRPDEWTMKEWSDKARTLAEGENT